MSAAVSTRRWWEIPDLGIYSVLPWNAPARLTITSTRPFWCEARAQRLAEAPAAWRAHIDGLCP